MKVRQTKFISKDIIMNTLRLNVPYKLACLHNNCLHGKCRKKQIPKRSQLAPCSIEWEHKRIIPIMFQKKNICWAGGSSLMENVLYGARQSCCCCFNCCFCFLLDKVLPALKKNLKKHTKSHGGKKNMHFYFRIV